jgi:hypothetical protein
LLIKLDFAATPEICDWKPIEAGVCLRVCLLDLLAKASRRHFGQVDEGFDRLDLAEEQPASPRRVFPVQQQALRFRRHAPLARRQLAPRIDAPANFFDERIPRDPGAGRAEQVELRLSRPAAASRGDWDNLDALAPISELHPGRLTFFVELVVERRLFKRGRDDRVIDEPHALPLLHPLSRANELNATPTVLPAKPLVAQSPSRGGASGDVERALGIFGRGAMLARQSAVWPENV